MAKNMSAVVPPSVLMAELNVVRRRYNSQKASIDKDTAFLADKEIVARMPATAQSVLTRLKRTEAAFRITAENLAELERATGAIGGM